MGQEFRTENLSADDWGIPDAHPAIVRQINFSFRLSMQHTHLVRDQYTLDFLAEFFEVRMTRKFERYGVLTNQSWRAIRRIVRCGIGLWPCKAVSHDCVVTFADGCLLAAWVDAEGPSNKDFMDVSGCRNAAFLAAAQEALGLPSLPSTDRRHDSAGLSSKTGRAS